ncbi:MAG: LCP family protein [Clostridiales bacterium]|jgi:LCP family protein required for cell wall assembly|nr:LCP family protein [Clostridiales bacterium]
MNKQPNAPQNRPPKKSLLRFYVKIVSSVCGAFFVILAIALIAYSRSEKARKNPPPVSLPALAQTQGGGPASPGPAAPQSVIEPKDKTFFLIVGTDASKMLTDVIIAGCFDKNDMTVNLISVPRDTYTKMEPADIASLQASGHHPPSSGIMKLNAVHSYAGRENGILYTKKYVEKMLGISSGIDYWAEVDLAAFRNIVDAVGGVSMNVPAGGLYYDDPYQKLHIAVPGGYQHLDGAAAEGVVRYRHTYRRGDLQRIEVQQEFLRQFFAQALNKEAIKKNAASFAATLINYTRTNFTAADIPKYVKYIGKLNGEDFAAYTCVGEDNVTINGANFFIMDEDKTRALTAEVFLKKKSPPPDESGGAAEAKPKPATTTETTTRPG